jgi:septal ring factor EnvC (AmiA/AmiB activator)
MRITLLGSRGRAVALVLLALVPLAGSRIPVSAQQPAPATPGARAADRIAALRHEAERLAAEERTVLGDLRKLEVERDLRLEEARKLDAEAASVAARLDEATRQIETLDEAIRAARPALNGRLVEVYKLGRPGYARVWLAVGGDRDIGRATRLVSAMAQIDQRRVQAFAASIARLNAAKASLAGEAARLQTLRADAVGAAQLASQAAAAREAFVRQIDARRDLNAQMAGELEAAALKLQKAVQPLPASSPSELVVLPIASFRGALEWPASGRLVSRFGERRALKYGSATTQNGVEVEAVDGQPVRAVHDGRVTFADVFTGLGQLVIVDHGGLAFSLYGYLGSIGVAKGRVVTAGEVVGTAGRAPSGSPAVYFELRIDGRPVDPLQWLKARQEYLP